MVLNITQVAERVDALKERYTARDERMQNVLAVRNGDLSFIGSDFFPEGFNHPMIANFIDVAARDIAEVMAPLPTISCSTANFSSDADKKTADKKTQVANHYIQFSDLETQNYIGVDWYNSYGTYNLVVEPDLEAGMPRIRIDNPINAYPEYDRFGRVVAYAKIYKKTVRELVVEFPEQREAILSFFDGGPINWKTKLDMVRYEDKDQITLYLPYREIILASTENPMGKVMVRIGRRPALNPDDPRGQFDDVIWVQLARARFSFLAMEAAEKSVQAPIVVPQDMQDLAFGPDAIIRTQNPAGVRRVGLELPTGAFTEQQILQGEMRMGSRYPEGRSGQIDANIITGQGVQALLGGFDTQVKSAQQIFSRVLEEVIALCFEMDEKLFNNKKTVSGLYQGAPYKLDYKPSSIIKSDYSVQVRYGLMSGLDPSRALIFSLQALGAGLLSREWVMHEMPFAMNVTEVQKTIEIEKMRDSLSAAFSSMAQAIPQMVLQGGDPVKIVSQFSDVIQARKAGKTIEDAVSEVFGSIQELQQQQQQVTPTESPSPVEASGAPGSEGAVGASSQPIAPMDASSILQQIAAGGGMNG